MPSSSRVYLVSNPIPERLVAASAALPVAIGRVMEYNANDGQNYMRENAPWTDRTGNARQGLFARYYKESKMRHVIVLYHSVPYGVYLELAMGRRYKIVEPAWRRTAEQTMSDLNKVMGALG